MSPRFLFGTLLSAIGIIAPAMVLGLIFGFDERLSRDDGEAAQVVGLLASLVVGFASGTVAAWIRKKSNGNHDPHWPPLEALRDLLNGPSSGPQQKNSRRVAA